MTTTQNDSEAVKVLKIINFKIAIFCQTDRVDAPIFVFLTVDSYSLTALDFLSLEARISELEKERDALIYKHDLDMRKIRHILGDLNTTQLDSTIKEAIAEMKEIVVRIKQ